MGIKPPSTRSEFEHNLNLIEEEVFQVVRSGNREMIENLKWATIPHLKEVQKLPNNRVHLPTVNEMIRLQANFKNSDPFTKLKDGSEDDR